MTVDLIKDAVRRIDSIMYNYESDQPAEILADIMHYCKAKGFDLAEQLNIAEDFVMEEESMMEEVYDRA